MNSGGELANGELSARLSTDGRGGVSDAKQQDDETSAKLERTFATSS